MSIINRIIILTFMALFNLNVSFAQLPTAAFWKNHANKLTITTSSQSVPTSICSGVVTIQSRNWLNVVKNQTSNLTINLATNGTLNFYSDSACTNAITTSTIGTGSNSTNIYFMSPNIETPTITVSANGYTPNIQNENIITNNFIWTGAGANANWNTAANWSGGVNPGASDVAFFDGSCFSNCSPTINANISVKGIRMTSSYTGSITQSAGFTITVGSSGWVQEGGSFMGGNSGMTLNGLFLLSGGSFTPTSGTLTMNNASWTVRNSPTFNGSVGSILFNTSAFLTAGTVHYNNVLFSGGCGSSNHNLNYSSMNIDGNLSLGGCSGSISSGTMNLVGNLTGTIGGSAAVNLVGNPSGQTVSGTIPGLIISAGTYNVTISGVLNLGGLFNMNSVGTLTLTGSTLNFQTGTSIIPGNIHYNNVTFGSGCGSWHSLNNNTMYIDGTTTFSTCSAGINSGTINMAGNLNAVGEGTNGNAQLIFSGATQQTVTKGASSAFPTGNITVQQTGGANLILGSNISWNSTGQTLSVTSGSINMAGFALTVKGLNLNSNTITKNGGILTVNGVTAGTGSLYGGIVDP